MSQHNDDIRKRLDRVRELQREAEALRGRSGYQRHKARAAERQRMISAAGRDIAPLPDVVDQERRDACHHCLRTYLETYYATKFTKPWSDQQLRLIARAQECITAGGQYAVALHRYGGKTTILERSIIWGIKYGWRFYGVLLGCDQDHVKQLVETIKTELLSNDLLLDDFPDFVYPIVQLGNIPQKKLTLEGRPIGLRWLQDRIVFPTIEGTAARGQILRIASLLGATRGFKHLGLDGKQYRPDFVLIDEAQTDDSARSRRQCARRESVISKAVLGAGGPDRKVAACLGSTVIQRDDTVDRLLDRKRHPAWRGERWPFVVRWPVREDLWNEYARIRAADFEADGDGSAATNFYRENREEMDRGAEVGWAHAYDEEQGEISALQRAWNARIDSPDAFWSEFQNAPLDDEEDALSASLTPQLIESRAIELPWGRVPQDAQVITIGADVGEKVLWWIVAAWGESFTGHIIEYGTTPKQKRRYFTENDIQATLMRRLPGAGFEAALRKGLQEMLSELFERTRTLDGGDGEMGIHGGLIDANWHRSTDLVYEVLRRPPSGVGRSTVYPSHGIGISAKRKPLNAPKRKKGERRGLNWRVPPQSDRGIRHVVYDTNYWKSLVAARLQVEPGDPGALTLPKREGGHRMLAEHLTSERAQVMTSESTGRTVEEWEKKTDDAENHLWDCLVMAAVAASMHGINPPGVRGESGKRRSRAAVRYI